MQSKKEIPTQKIRQYLYKVSGIAISNKKYRWAIRIFEEYFKKYKFTEGDEYRFALLYDHFAMIQKNKNLFTRYLKKAKKIYKGILKRNPKNLHALYGLGRVYGAKNDFKKALFYQKKAYKEMLKLPKKQRGALAIGALYQRMENYKNAEKWYLREYKNAAKNDFGTALNLFNFYKEIRNRKRALFYGLKTEKLMKIEYKKKIYKGLKMRDSDFLKSITKDIREIKKMMI